MKRRHLIVASAVIANGVVSRPARTAFPSRYVTRFDRTENPLSEGGRWLNGKAAGLDWHDAKSVGGVAQASALSGISHRYDDSIAALSGTFAPDQYAQGTVFRSPGYSPLSKHEIELLLRFQISEHRARGYEVLWGHDGDFAIVRWNGRLGDFTIVAEKTRPELGGHGPGPGIAVDGDVLRAEIAGDVIKVYKNGGLVFVGPPNPTWTTGQPGLGFWPISGAALHRYGWKTYEAGSLE